MKMNDYLWDKTGSDPEIEKLESQLAVFRSAHSKAPSIVGASETERTHGFFLSFFRLRTAAALAMSLLMVFAAAWVLSTMREEIPDVSPVFASLKVPPAEIPDTPSQQTVRDSAGELPGRTMRVQRRRPAGNQHFKAALPVTSAQPPSAPQTAALTTEERKAYDKLMLALSITSSKLKMVQDKADGSPSGGPGR